MTETTALAVVSPENKLEKSGGEGALALMGRAKDVAGVCREIVMRTAMELQGRRYVKVEGWQSMATAFGCSPSIREVTEDEGGVRAVAELRRHDGVVLATAEGYCGMDEPKWANQAAYARRGMAQTRAISRVCRNVFAFVVVLIDENLSTTPFEEVPANDDAAVSVVTGPAANTNRPVSGDVLIRDKSTQVRFGRCKGKYLCDIAQEDLDYQLAAAQKSVAANDPKWGEANKKWLGAVENEAARRGPSAKPAVTVTVAVPKATSKTKPKSVIVDVQPGETEEQAAHRHSEPPPHGDEDAPR